MRDDLPRLAPALAQSAPAIAAGAFRLPLFRTAFRGLRPEGFDESTGHFARVALRPARRRRRAAAAVSRSRLFDLGRPGGLCAALSLRSVYRGGLSPRACPMAHRSKRGDSDSGKRKATLHRSHYARRQSRLRSCRAARPAQLVLGAQPLEAQESSKPKLQTPKSADRGGEIPSPIGWERVRVREIEI